MPVAIFPLIALTGQVPANGKPAIFRKMPEQRELSEIADSSDLLNLHRASTPITDGFHFFGSIGPHFRQLSRKSHRTSDGNGGHLPAQVIDLGR
jgi:hypothetical protein